MKIGDLIKPNLSLDHLDAMFPVDQIQTGLERREKSADLAHLSSLSEDEQEVERMRFAVQNLVFSQSEVSLKKPSDKSYVSGVVGDDQVHHRRDQTTYNYKLAALDTESV